VINRVYSTLLMGMAASGPYARRVDPAAGYDIRLSASFIPPGSDADYKAYCADQLCGICARSPLASILEALDPHNTYSFEVPPVSAVTEVAGFFRDRLVLQEPSLPKEWLDHLYSCVIIPSSKSIEINGVRRLYTWEAGLSGVVDTGDGIAFRLTGPEPSSPQNFSIRAIRPAHRDIRRAYSDIMISGMKILPQFLEYIQDQDINVALPALVLNYAAVVAA